MIILSAFKRAEMVYKKNREVTILARGVHEGIQFTVMSIGSHPCAYVGVPSSDVLAGAGYEDVPIACHGGLTYSYEGDDQYLEKGFFWFGWDYAHLGDYVGRGSFGDKKWSTDEILSEVWSVIYDFKKLQKFSEHVLIQWLKRTGNADYPKVQK